ncbi:MAG: hypothetical protein GU348_04725 [Thermogladius sp.]|jgi:hypothetical protein|nr:hypothetical protein [Thermogladius sp.]
MSSSLRPCPADKEAGLDLSGGSVSLYICLKEDRRYEREELERAVSEEMKNKGVNTDNIGVKADEVVERLAVFLSELRNLVVKSITEVYGERGFTDISLPKIEGGFLNPGEFPGNFLIYKSGGSNVLLHVEPKIGWRGYINMLSDTRQSIDLFAEATGIIEPLIGNLYYPSLSSPVSYSLLLLRLTELILSSTAPKKTVKFEVLSEGVAGRLKVAETVRHILQGSPYRVYERIKVEPYDYPYMLLARFHYELSLRLRELLEILRDVAGSEEFYQLISEKLMNIWDLHVHYLTTPPIQQAFGMLAREYVPDDELIEEARRASRVNPHFGLLADLYEMYLSDMGLIHEHVEKGAILPSASSKIYELWVLTRIMMFLKEKHGGLPRVEEYEDLYIILKSKKVRLLYNKPSPGFFTDKLSEKGLLHRHHWKRPDFILETRGDFSEQSVVYDAKYKFKLATGDVVRLLAYIAEFAMPVEEDQKKMLVGGFYKLMRGGAGSSGIKYYPIVKNDVLPMKVAINVFELDPRMLDSEVNSIVEQSLQLMLKE